jgi:hypothetical protein
MKKIILAALGALAALFPQSSSSPEQVKLIYQM